MIIHDFYVIGISVSPNKADSPLVIDTDAVLAPAVAFQGFQMIVGRYAQILQPDFGRAGDGAVRAGGGARGGGEGKGKGCYRPIAAC